jgi:putative ABC transport system permease protein
MSKFLRRATRRVRALFRHDALDAELDEEIRLHVELETEDLMRTRGLSRDEARRQAMVGFGGVERYREAQRDARGVRWIEQIAQDVKYAARSLRKSPGFVVTSVLTIALGIGVTTTVYSVVNRLILHPLPFANADRVVLFGNADGDGQIECCVLSNDVVNWQQHAKSFAAISFLGNTGGILDEGNHSIEAGVTQVSPGLFEALRVRPVLGRSFIPADTVTGAPRVMLLGESFWRREFGASPGVIGRRLTLSDSVYTVIGVMPDQLVALVGYYSVDLWMPITSAELHRYATSVSGVQAVGVLKEGVPVARAQEELALLQRRLVHPGARPAAAAEPTVRLAPPSAFLDPKLVSGLWLALGATILVVLIACANVANLQVVRASRRSEEIAVRAALGASRGRIIRQLFIESLLLAVVGGATGIAASELGLHLIVALRPVVIPQVQIVTLDGRVLAFAAGLVLLTTVLYGIVPAWHATGGRLSDALHGVAKVGGWRRRRGLQSFVVVIEVSMSLLLLAGAGLLARSLVNMLAINPGFQASGLLEVTSWAARVRYPDSTARAAYWSSVIARVRAVPGVQGVAPAEVGMLQSVYGLASGKVEVSDGPHATAPVEVMFASRRVPGDYFRILGIHLIAGRTFTPEDEAGQTHAMIVDSSFAQRLWPGESAIGKQFRMYAPSYHLPWNTVRAVVSDVGLVGLPGIVAIQQYEPARPGGLSNTAGLLVRVKPGSSGSTVLGLVRGAMQSVDPHVPVTTATTESALLDQALATPRFSTTLIGAFAVLALLLAAVGLYGVVAHGVSLRTHEIGVRIAMGARLQDISTLVLGDGARLALWGVGLGVIGALAAGRLLASLLYGVSPADPVVMVIVPLVLIATALLASYLPARRAARVDPVIALRAE